jgi:hypothetical protein
MKGDHQLKEILINRQLTSTQDTLPASTSWARASNEHWSQEQDPFKMSCLDLIDDKLDKARKGNVRTLETCLSESVKTLQQENYIVEDIDFKSPSTSFIPRCFCHQ